MRRRGSSSVGAASRRAAKAARRRVALALLLAGWLAPAPTAEAAAFISILDNALILTPTPTDYANDYVELTGLAGMGIKVKTNSPAGLVLMVRSASGSSPVALGDFLIRTLTPPGTGGVSLTTYTPLAASNLNLWSTGVVQGPFKIVDMDVRIRNLFNYNDASGAGTTSYTNTLVFTVIEP